MLSPSDALRLAILRITEVGRPTETLGTAFAISESVALTCAHVVQTLDEVCLQSETTHGLLHKARVVLQTWFLCELAKRESAFPALLIEASNLHQDAQFISDLISSSIASAAAEKHGGLPQAVEIPSSVRLAAACSDIGRPLVVLLDGVNEALDVKGFLKNWLPNATGWCRQHSARLIFTTRPEAWPLVVRVLPAPKQLLYAREKNNSNDAIVNERPDQRYLRLTDFTAVEAETAGNRYGIASVDQSSVDRHPFLFRVIRELESGAADLSVGRYRLLDDFIDRHLVQATNSFSELRILRARLGQIAQGLPAAGSGTLAREEAAITLGGDSVLNRLVDLNLLRITGDRITFTYDQIADALRPASNDCLAAFRALSRATEPDLIAIGEAVSALLRLEADDQEEAFRDGFDLLKLQLDLARKSLLGHSDYYGD